MARTTAARRPRSGKPVPPPAPRRSWVPVTGLVTAFVLGFAVAFLVSSWTSGPDASESRIEELKQAEAQRDVEQIEVLIELGRGGQERLAPVLVAMAEVAPLDATAAPAPRVAPTAEQVRGWREIVAAEAARYTETPSAGNGVNVARTGLRTAVEQLTAAVDTFDAALTAAEPLRGRLLALAGTQRTVALRAWSVAALQLDVISVDAGKGHVLVQLPSGPNSGRAPLDSEPEGSGSR